MNRFGALTAIGIALMPVLAIAETKPPKPAAMTIADCQALNHAIKALDGHYATDAAGRPVMAHSPRGAADAPILIPYDFDPGVIDKLADDETMLDAVQQRVDAAARSRMQKEAPGIFDLDAKSAAGQKLQLEYQAALAEPCDVHLQTIAGSELRVDQNKLPPSVLSGLHFVIQAPAK